MRPRKGESALAFQKVDASIPAVLPPRQRVTTYSKVDKIHYSSVQPYIYQNNLPSLYTLTGIDIFLYEGVRAKADDGVPPQCSKI